MQKSCSFCDNGFKDGEEISFIAHGNFKVIPSKINFAIDKDFLIEDLYHPSCMQYVLGGGK